MASIVVKLTKNMLPITGITPAITGRSFTKAMMKHNNNGIGWGAQGHSNSGPSSTMHHGKIMWGENPNNESGSCGTPYSDNDLVVAISKKLFDSSKCGKMIDVYAGEKKASVRMVDSCESCDIDALVLSKGAFKIFSELDKGVFDGKWTFSDETLPQWHDVAQEENIMTEITEEVCVESFISTIPITADEATTTTLPPTTDEATISAPLTTDQATITVSLTTDEATTYATQTDISTQPSDKIISAVSKSTSISFMAKASKTPSVEDKTKAVIKSLGNGTRPGRGNLPKVTATDTDSGSNNSLPESTEKKDRPSDSVAEKKYSYGSMDRLDDSNDESSALGLNNLGLLAVHFFVIFL